MSDSRKQASHPAQKRYPPELRERETRMVLEIFETGERHGVIGRVARQLGIGTETLPTRPRSTAGGGRGRPARSGGVWPSWRRRTGSCAGRMRSFVPPRRFSRRRSSTAGRSSRRLYRRLAGGVRSRADLSGAAGRPFHLLRQQEPAAVAPGGVRRRVAAGDQAYLGRQRPGLWGGEDLVGLAPPGGRLRPGPGGPADAGPGHLRGDPPENHPDYGGQEKPGPARRSGPAQLHAAGPEPAVEPVRPRFACRERQWCLVFRRQRDICRGSCRRGGLWLR
jgi:transposase-like protein